jgi:hypothetical protein
MHPDIAHVLARERQAELLRQNQFRHRQSGTSLVRAARPTRRVRRSLGAALVAAGTRLIGNAPATLELFESRR